MPFTYERDDKSRRVIITFQGAYQARDAFASLERHIAEGVGDYGLLYDLLGMSGQPTDKDLHQHMEKQVQSNQRGPIAILVTNPALHRKARTYKSLAAELTIEVFRERSEAEMWLMIQIAKSHT